ncbi:MAG TPA: hypothetical protein ENI15_19340 [Spirochaetes bacterium]|nr:hypothetical protein [Spirochaetota bacterium]
MDVWKSDTCIISSDTDIAMHPAYQEIIGMGSDAIPMILEELEREPDNWFWALKAISSEDPTPHSLKGNIQKMTEAWLNWGRENNYIKLRHV